MFSILKKKLLKATTEMFPKKPALTFNGKGSHNSLLSKIFSILVSFAFLAICIFYGSQLWLKNKPVISVTSVTSIIAPTIKVNNSNFFLAFRLEDRIDGHNQILTEKFKYKAHIYKDTIFPNDTTKFDEISLNITRCSNLKNLDDGVRKYFNNLEKHYNETVFNSLYCIDLGNNNTELSGYYGQAGTASSIRISFYGCNNTNWNDTDICDPISDLMTYPKINFHVMEVVPNLRNYSFPSFNRISNYYDCIDPNTYREGEFEIKIGQIQTDDGLFTNNLNTITVPIVSSFTKYQIVKNHKSESFSGSGVDGGVFYELNIGLSSEIVTYRRTYSKIPLILAQVLSVVKIMLLLVRFFIGKFTKRSYQEFFINKCMEIDSDDKEKSDKKNKISDKENKPDDKYSKETMTNKKILENPRTIDMIEIKQNTNSVDNLTKVNLKDKDEKKKSKEKDKEKNLNFSFCESLHIVCLEKSCHKRAISKKEKLFKNAFKKLKIQFDVHTLIQENLHLKIIFDILFNPDQQIFFNFFKKPQFDVKQYTEVEKLKKDEEHNKKLLDQLHIYYQDNKNNGRISKIDEMLLNMLKDKDKIKIQQDTVQLQIKEKLEENNESQIDSHIEQQFKAGASEINESHQLEGTKISCKKNFISLNENL